MQKEVVFVDMDGVIADFERAVREGGDDRIKGFFMNIKPIPEGIEAVKELARYYNIYIASTPSWSNPYSWTEKRLWIEQHFGNLLKKKLILTHNKSLLCGFALIDDNTWNGAKDFRGDFIHFKSEKYPNWDSVLNHLLPKGEPVKKGKGLGALFAGGDLEHQNGNSYKPNINKMEKGTEKSYTELLAELRTMIEIQLELCEPEDTPVVCRMKQDGEGKEKLAKLIIKEVTENGLTVSQAIIEIERQFNPNMLEN